MMGVFQPKRKELEYSISFTLISLVFVFISWAWDNLYLAPDIVTLWILHCRR